MNTLYPLARVSMLIGGNKMSGMKVGTLRNTTHSSLLLLEITALQPHYSHPLFVLSFYSSFMSCAT